MDMDMTATRMKLIQADMCDVLCPVLSHDCVCVFESAQVLPCTIATVGRHCHHHLGSIYARVVRISSAESSR